MIEGMIVGAALGLLGAIIAVIYQFAKRAKKAAAPKVADLKKTTWPKVKKLAERSGAAISNRAKTEEEEVLEIGDEFFETASNEISQNTQKQGLWLKSLALAEGDETKQKATYIRLRAKQLSQTIVVDERYSAIDEPKEDEIEDERLELEEVNLRRFETLQKSIEAAAAARANRQRRISDEVRQEQSETLLKSIEADAAARRANRQALIVVIVCLLLLLAGLFIGVFERNN